MPQQRQSQYGGYSGLLGLPKGVSGREDMLRHKKKQGADQFRTRMADLSKGMNQSDSVVFQQFAQLGSMLGNKLGGSEGVQLSPEEERGLSIMEGANTKMTELSTSPEWAKMDDADRSFASQKALADSAYEAGDMDTYLSIIGPLGQQRVAHRQNVAAMRTAEAGAESAEDKSELAGKATEIAMRELNEGKPVTMVGLGQNGRPDTSQIQELRQLPDGTMVDMQGQPVDRNKWITMEHAQTVAGIIDKLPAGQASPVDYFNDVYTAKERQGLRQNVRDLDSMHEITNTMADVMEATDNPEDIVGNPGAMNRFGMEVVSAVKGAGRIAKVWTTVGEDGKGQGVSRGLNELAGEYIQDDWVPAAFRDNAAKSAQWKSAIMQMVYTDARLNEPGARQLSDADIKNAMDRLGVNISDPAAVLEVFGTNIASRYSTTKMNFEYAANIMAPVGGRAGLTKVLGTDPFTKIEQYDTALKTRFGNIKEDLGYDDQDRSPGEQSVLDRF